MMGWEMKAEIQGSRAHLRCCPSPPSPPSQFLRFLVVEFAAKKNKVKRREGRFPRVGFVDPTL